jgi:hypothetical protein
MSTPLFKRIKNPFKDTEEKFITAVEQFYSSNGRLPFYDDLLDLGAVGSSELTEKEALAEYERLVNSEYVQKALEVLGIKLDPSEVILMPRQLAAIQVMFDFNDGRSDAKKLKDLGVSGQTWQNWLKDPVFQKFCQDKAESLYGDNSHDIDRALFSRARTGNTEAIKLYLQVTGKLKPEIAAPKVGTQDSHYFLIRIMETIQETLVDHPDLLKLLGQRIRAISNPFLGEQQAKEIIVLQPDDRALENNIRVLEVEAEKEGVIRDA